ncbi:hypothetical protein Tco_0168828 [Tanacetum coccineum]
MDREVKRLKQSKIPIVKVCWNSRRAPEYTWEREDQMQKKYPHHFAKPESASQATESLLGSKREISDGASPNYVLGPEHPPSPIEIPFIPEPEYPEYLVPSEDEAPMEDHASPVALSPGYVPDSDPEEDPEEDSEEEHANYPADGGDGDDEPSDDDTDDDDADDDDEEPFEDEEDGHRRRRST